MRHSLAIRFVLSAFCMLFVSSFLKAQELSIIGKLDRAEMQIGEQAVIDITIRTADLTHTHLQIPTDSTMSRIEILAFGITDTVVVKDPIVEIKAKMVITSFDSTLLEIPPFIVTDGQDKVMSKSLFLKVTMPEIDLSKPDSIYDIKEPWGVSYTWSDIFNIMLRHPLTWTILATFLAVLSYLFYKRYKENQARRPVVIPETPAIPAYDRAIAALESLRAKKLVEAGLYKEYFTELTDLLRSYIAETREIDAREMTSSEILQALQRIELPEKGSRLLHGILQTADLAKFAKYKPIHGEDVEAIRDARAFLDEVHNIRES
ncbi:hypothetical protein JFY67_02730 [Porphyromonas gingivalis]|uniref:hypothetical protein n=1 Tax=Porphyromonas gingivalis TaxID=837 RepID=UPI001F2B02AA|nr:hypothetical protein [Porphyromonas gingivalis]MCE8174375.1 hypothetical protein [Porphyromonas gingivalis]